jgi:hypothetical protein
LVISIGTANGKPILFGSTANARITADVIAKMINSQTNEVTIKRGKVEEFQNREGNWQIKFP